MDVSMRGSDNCMTNMIDLHTFTIGIVDLVVVAILLIHRHLLELMSDVIRSADVCVPICINTM